MVSLCLDGGGTKTTAVVVDDQGSLLGCGIGGPLAFVSSGGPVVARSARDAASSAVEDAGIGVADIDTAVVILGGGNVEEAQAAVRAAIGSDSVTILGELGAAEQLAEAGGYDVMVLAGTGTIAFGRRPEGGWAVCGGLGVLVGDEGSGFWIGWEAIRAVVRALDGRAPAIDLVQPVLAHMLGDDVAGDFGMVASERRDTVGRIRFATLNADRSKIAALAPIVSQRAEAGDEVALGLLDRAGQELALHALALLESCGHAPRGTVAGLGGVLRAGNAVTDPFTFKVLRGARRAKVVIPDLDLIAGAAMLAVRGAGKGADARRAVRARKAILRGWWSFRERLEACRSSATEQYAGPSITEQLGAIE